MKIIKYTFPIILSLILFGISLQAQVVNDPVKNIYRIGGSSEIYIAYNNHDTTYAKQGLMYVPPTLNDIKSNEDPYQTKYMDVRISASASGDFDGDGADEVVSIFNNNAGGIKLSIPEINKELLIGAIKEYDETDLNIRWYARLRICSGNFDDDPQDEFAICYGKMGQPMTVSLFETDADLNIKLIDSFKEIAYYDCHFDIASGDVDGDGIDEIVMVKNEATPWETNGDVNPPVFNSMYDLYILEYNTDTGMLEMKSKRDDLVLENKAGTGDYFDHGMIINEMRIACGDLNADGKDEMVVAWSNYYSHRRVSYCSSYFLGICTGHSWRYYFCDMLFLNTFKLMPSDTIENYQNIYATYTDYDTRAVPASQHVALSLKCEKMDNIGREEVLVNGSSRFCVFGSGDADMGLEKKVEISIPGYINIQGNETFVVADLNPDTVEMNFNKEVIILNSNNSPAEQLNTKATGINELVILSVETINSDTIVFKAPDPAHDIPFDESDNITISSFLTGDFDLQNSEIYFVGTPEVIPVLKLQHPLVILNSPPVHFDVIDGEIYDICNAYTNNETPSFFAKYNTIVEEQKTTSVEVNSGFGLSSELKAYAMAGGSGFESTARSNWQMGKSFYNANSQNKVIEEEKSVYTEDYILYSSLNYTYYKYPVYNIDNQKVGNMAVLNPDSDEMSSDWGSGNSWNHPAYIFNHEVGNILSYKSCMNSLDFCTGDAGFTSCDYSKVLVANTGDGSFKFTYNNISSEGSSYSFSGGVGADLFTKVGIETTVTAELAPFGFGGSVSTDIRIGVSSELSTFYNSSSLNTHNTELSNTFQIDGYIGRLDKKYDGNARYSVQPYIYRSQSGALILDYMVELDNSSRDWWETNYGQKTDLAFILPWRYAEEKGNADIKISKKQKTNEIQFYPPIVHPGDTVCITARVHNYSLLTFDDLLKVTFYLGDPEVGGVQLTDVFGESESSKYSTMMHGEEDANLDFEEYMSFSCVIPDTVTCSPRIYAIIDPDNDYDEIHENNNKGWNMLHIYDCSDCGYAEPANVGSLISDPGNFNVYPNPFNDFTTVRFTVPANEMVSIELFDLSGHKIREITKSSYPAGSHEVSFNAGDLADGIYFCEINAGNYSNIKKLVHMK